MTTDAEVRARIRLFLPPLTIILVCIPLLLQMIPRNRWYGVRVREALASDAAWYAVNQLGAAAIIAASVVWLAAAAYGPRRYVKAIGVGAILFSLALLVLTQGWTL